MAEGPSVFDFLCRLDTFYNTGLSQTQLTRLLGRCSRCSKYMTSTLR